MFEKRLGSSTCISGEPIGRQAFGGKKILVE